MAMEAQIDPRKNFVPRRLPWLLAAAMLLVYWLTLNRWVSFFNLPSVSKISGWTWQPEVFGPVTYLVTYPLRWLPTAAVPLALNLFSSVCAALALCLLARSVAVLPHDRTDAQRKRETSDFSFLTTGTAWLPPLLAVLVCGLQLTFWERATNWTGEMFDLLLFAVVIWSLLEYRLGEREWRLYVAAFVFAAGMTDDWGMVGFFPLFLVAIVWLRGFDFFNLRFLGRITLCGLAGLLLFYLLLPLLAVAFYNMPYTFWQYLKFNLSLPDGVLRTYFAYVTHPAPHIQQLSLLLAYLMPPLMLVVRWKSSFGDTSRIGVALASFVFHLLHAGFLLGCVWLAFDPSFSPRHKGYGLMLYYLIALSIGYYSGYFLLVFGKKIARQRVRQPGLWQWLNRPVVAGVWLLAVVAVAGLACRNAPQIRDANGDTFRRYTSLVEETLPAAGGYLLCDDPQQLALVRSALLRDGRAGDFVPLETQSLVVPAYHRYLHRQFPQGWPELVSATQTNALNPIGLIQALARLARTNDFVMARTNLYYLQPSFGYYFEQFYLEPHGLVYKMVTLPADTLLPPLPDGKLIAENETFWAQAAAQALTPIEHAVAPRDPNAPRSWGERVLDIFHVPREPDQMAALAGVYYSRSLDFWGVELQRARELEQAAARFGDALKLNPDNVVAQINLHFNQILRAGHTAPVDLSKTTADQFGKYPTWSDLLSANGPFDEPSFCFENGVNLAAGNGYFRQAIASFDRVRELAPDYLPARLWLGQIYVMARLPGRALDALRDPLADPGRFLLVETNETELHVLAAAAYFQETNFTRGSELLDTEIARHPEDNDLLASTAQAYMVRGMFDKAMGVIDRKLRFVPDDPAWLYSKGYVSIQQKNYAAAIAALSRVLAVQTNNNDALFNRAIANLDSDHLAAARADYLRLQQTFSNSFQVAYGLGEIAWRQHDTNEAVRNFRIYLANADTNSGEAQTVLERLKSLKR
jgi:tetratricopeptide (TPR) repeat protein